VSIVTRLSSQRGGDENWRLFYHHCSSSVRLISLNSSRLRGPGCAMGIIRYLPLVTKSCTWKAVLMSLLVVAAPLPLLAGTPDLSGTYSADDGGVYYMQQSGNVLWRAGLSLDRDLPADYVWHRGLHFTNVFRGTISNGTVMGDWADVSRGVTMSKGTLRERMSSRETTSPGRSSSMARISNGRSCSLLRVPYFRSSPVRRSTMKGPNSA
jgi:hypothetical protein